MIKCFIRGNRYIVGNLIRLVNFFNMTLIKSAKEGRYALLDGDEFLIEGSIYELKDYLESKKLEEESNLVGHISVVFVKTEAAPKVCRKDLCALRKGQVRLWLEQTLNLNKAQVSYLPYQNKGEHIIVSLATRDLKLWVDDAGEITSKIQSAQGRPRKGWTAFRRLIIAEASNTVLQELDYFRRLSDYD